MMESSEYVVVIGGINLDIKGWPAGRLRPGTSNPGHIYTSAGGVGRNIAHNLALLGVPVRLLGVVGADAAGARLIAELRQVGVATDALCIREDHATGMYLSILNEDHDLAVAIAGMTITDTLDIAYFAVHAPLIQRSRFVVTETNIPVDVLAYILVLSRQADVPCLVEPVSVEKGLKILDVPGSWNYMTPNLAELAALTHEPIHTLSDMPEACVRLANSSQYLLVTCGEDGVYVYDCKRRVGTIFPAFQTAIIDSTGAGDALVAGFVSAVVRNYPQDQSVRIGLAAAMFTLQSEHTVNPQLSFERCLARVAQT